VDVVNHADEVGAVRETLFAGRQNRDDAVSAIFLAHHRRLVGLSSLLVDDPGSAEEVVQEAFLALYRQYRLLRDPSAAVAYLNRCVVNGGRRRLIRRRSFAARLLLLDPPDEAQASAEQEAAVHDLSDSLWRGLQQLPCRQREVLVLRYYLDQSEAEIAETLGISRGSVKTHASRGLAALAQRLDMEP
jgi:RNA polymerase sigma-70 factor (sigma-E family)